MPVFKVEVERKLYKRITLYVRAEDREKAEERAAKHAAEEVADEDMRDYESEDFVTCLEAVPPDDVGLLGKDAVIS